MMNISITIIKTICVIIGGILAAGSIAFASAELGPDGSVKKGFLALLVLILSFGMIIAPQKIFDGQDTVRAGVSIDCCQENDCECECKCCR